MEKDRLYAKLIALSIIYEKSEESRKAFVEKLKFREGEYQEILNEIDDLQFKQWVESIKSQLK